tara:strand:- start:80 stop:346 length:267 start_codon:yes stop_codon:yes gene_type:complete
VSTSPGNDSHRTGIILNDQFSDHLTTSGHPESPDRIAGLSEYLPECAIRDQWLQRDSCLFESLIESGQKRVLIFPHWADRRFRIEVAW